MINRHVVLADIQTTDLVYFDPEFKDVCLDFCTNRDIDCLPSLTDAMKYHEKNGTFFEEKDLTPERIVDSQTPIFDPSLLERFCTHKLLFVTTNNQVSGVVHFSDYNKSVVHTHLFNLISQFERSLRILLRGRGFTNEDALDRFKPDLKKNRFINMDKLKPFEWCYLEELITFANEKKVITVCKEINKIRRFVMHSRDLIEFGTSYDENYFIYSLDSFVNFFNLVTLLLRDSKKVDNRIALFSLKEKYSALHGEETSS